MFVIWLQIKEVGGGRGGSNYISRKSFPLCWHFKA